MKLSLIAMSGSGKSYWSAKLAKHGFRHFDCDRMIDSKLGSALMRSDGTVLSLGELFDSDLRFWHVVGNIVVVAIYPSR